MRQRDVGFLGSVALLAFSGVVLAAMLGQVDMILSGWYSNPGETWTLPLPSLHWLSTSGGFLGVNPSGVLISANDAWSSIYAYIVGAYLMGVVSAFVLGNLMAREGGDARRNAGPTRDSQPPAARPNSMDN